MDDNILSPTRLDGKFVIINLYDLLLVVLTRVCPTTIVCHIFSPTSRPYLFKGQVIRTHLTSDSKYSFRTVVEGPYL